MKTDSAEVPEELLLERKLTPNQTSRTTDPDKLMRRHNILAHLMSHNVAALSRKIEA
jgi:hypothetical protein